MRTLLAICFCAAAAFAQQDVKLTRPGSITGSLRDAETKEPARHIPLKLFRIRWLRGERVVEETQLVHSDDDGGFHIDSVPPGEYAILMGNTTPTAASSDNKIYPAILWPAGGEADPIVVKNGERLDLGANDYAKVLPSHLIGPDCKGGEPPMQLTLEQSIGSGWAELGKISQPGCGVLSPLPPISQGRYRLNFMTTQSPDPAAGSEEVLVRRGEDAKVDLHLVPPASFTGSLTCDCAKVPPLPIRPFFAACPVARRYSGRFARSAARLGDQRNADQRSVRKNCFLR
jgi:hypothetical protein